MPTTNNITIKMNREEIIPCSFYFYLHYKLNEKYRTGSILSVKEVMNFLFEWRIPRELRPIIVKELELLDLIELVNKKSIRLNDSDFDLSDLREFYEITNIY